MNSPHILVVDDDRELRQLLSGLLERHGMRVDAVPDGRAMLRQMQNARFDLIVLDLMLPGEDGLALCRQLRTAPGVPLIMLTALAEETDRIVGLEMGADDYVVKPFSPRELVARIKAVLRRSTALPPQSDAQVDEYRFDGWRLDARRRELRSPDDALTPLTAGEFDLLLAFAQHPQRVLSRDQLLDLAKGRAGDAFDRAIDVQVSRLRRKIEADANDPQKIKTVRNGGYLFAPPVERRDRG